MTSRRLPTLLCAAILVAILVSASATFASGRVDLDSSGPDAVAAKPFLGRWDLTLKAPDREYPSWLEIRLEDGKLAAQMVGRWGNARSLPKVDISDGQVTFVSPKEEEDSPADWVFVGKPDGRTLSGSVTGPKGGPWTWSGVPAPLLQRKNTPKWGKPVSLFNGKDLTGWKMQILEICRGRYFVCLRRAGCRPRPTAATGRCHAASPCLRNRTGTPAGRDRLARARTTLRYWPVAYLPLLRLPSIWKIRRWQADGPA